MATAKEQLKELLPYLQRATEIEKADKKVAYYCRMYALEQGLRIPDRCQEATEFLVSIMGQLEADKPAANLASDPTEDLIYLQNFALKIFSNGDRADRAGRSDKQTAQSLYASTFFFDILRQFASGEIEADLAEKQRYAAWRAADINTAIKQGRQPNPPPSGNVPGPATDASVAGDASFGAAGPSQPPSQGDSAGPSAWSFPQPPASTFTPGPGPGPGPAPAGFSPAGFPPAVAPPAGAGFGQGGPSAQAPFQSPPPKSSPLRPSVSPSKPAPPPGFRTPSLADVPPGPSASGLPVQVLADAQKAAKHAASALQFDDVPTAVLYLQEALNGLLQQQGGSAVR